MRCNRPGQANMIESISFNFMWMCLFLPCRIFVAGTGHCIRSTKSARHKKKKQFPTYLIGNDCICQLRGGLLHIVMADAFFSSLKYAKIRRSTPEVDIHRRSPSKKIAFLVSSSIINFVQRSRPLNWCAEAKPAHRAIANARNTVGQPSDAMCHHEDHIRRLDRF